MLMNSARVAQLCRQVSSWRGRIPPELEKSDLVRTFDEEVMETLLEVWDEAEPRGPYAALDKAEGRE